MCGRGGVACRLGGGQSGEGAKEGKGAEGKRGSFGEDGAAVVGMGWSG